MTIPSSTTARLAQRLVARSRAVHHRSIPWHGSQKVFSTASAATSTTKTAAATKQHDETDVLIVGGGAVGCALARQLVTQVPGIRVDLVEAGPGHSASSDSHDGTERERAPHARSYALSPASLNVLGWKNKEDIPNHARVGFYDSMQIWEANQPSFLLFTSQDLGDGSSGLDYLGACVEDRFLVEHLWNEVHGKVKIHTNTTVSNLDVPESSSQGLAKVQLQCNDDSTQTREVKTHLLVAADGGNSSIRRMLGIPLKRLEYGQMALTFTVELQEPHRGRAFQRFLASEGGGAEPIALLPTFSDRHATIVWSTSPETVKQWKGHPGLLNHVNGLLQEGPQLLKNPLFGSSYDQNPKSPFTGGDTILSNLQYGAEKLIETIQYGPALMAAFEADLPFAAPPRIKLDGSVETSQQFAFPLTTGLVTTYADDQRRVALVGDAAHTMHPMAGQGLNLGMQDVADLTSCVRKAANAGMDVHTFVKSDYDFHRHLQVGATLAGIHSLHGMYGMQHAAAKHIKSVGMNVIQNVGMLRRQLAQAACHGVAVPS